MKKKFKWSVGLLVVIFLLMQLYYPKHTNPIVVSDLMATNHPPAEVAAILHASCYDCHSYETKWPWYSHIAPISWLVVSDVNEGRENLNLSEWPGDDPARAGRRLESMSEQVSYGEMPPSKYTLIHADARLTDAQRKALTNWLDSEAARLESLAPQNAAQ